jgi:hypothetical protein
MKPKASLKSLKEGPGDGVAALHLAPALELGERRLARVASQLLDHVTPHE